MTLGALLALLNHTAHVSWRYAKAL